MAAGVKIVMIFVVMVTSTTAVVDIPEYLRTGQMNKYKACRDLFAQKESSYAVDTRKLGNYNRICNCSYEYIPPRKEVNINCRTTREAVIPISFADYQYFGQIHHYLVRYKTKESGPDEWQEKIITASSSPEARIELDIGESRNPNVYVVEIYAVTSGGVSKLIFSDEIKSSTGKAVSRRPGYIGGFVPVAPPIRQPIRATDYTQYSQSYSMSFDRITDTSMVITFTTQNPEASKVEYIDENNHRRPLNLDANGRAELRDLKPNTEYIFIISFYDNGEWSDYTRKPVRTMPSLPTFGGSYNGPLYRPAVVGQDITLECPPVEEDTLLAISWFKGAGRETARLLATYNAETGTTTYPSDRDPRISLIDGRILRIQEPTREYAGFYKCRYTISGLEDYTWQSAVQTVTLYITWRTRDGIQDYLIQYRPYGVNAAWMSLVLADSETPNTVISNLQPETEYEFEVYDYSGSIKGDLLDSLTKTTSSSPQAQPIVVEADEGPVRNPCDSDPCMNGGVCRTRTNGYVCRCRRGYGGVNCERPPDHCASGPCYQGTCSSNDFAYVCRCYPGYTGRNCDQKVNQCLSNPCLDGICQRTQRGYYCQCYSGFTGTNCDTAINHCERRPCDQGTCINGVSGYTCQCYAGYTGQNCDQEEDPCLCNPCLNGHCQRSRGGYYCQCYAGFSGVNCDQITNHCEERPCYQGTCVNGVDSYTCHCYAGYIGQNCDQELTDPCDSNPCENRGECRRQSRGYYCRCRAGFTGQNCQHQQEDERCDSSTCKNDGVCVMTETGVTCRCRRGHTGRRCEISVPLDYCESHPCVYGTCTSLPESYKCTCDPGYKSRNCDVVDDSPYVMLRCPVESTKYGPAEVVQWYKVEDGTSRKIYEHDAVNGQGNEESSSLYQGRLSSPSSDRLRINDVQPSDIGTYKCITSYEETRTTSSPMRLVRIPPDENEVTVVWRPSRLYIDRYVVNYRDASIDGDYINDEAPRDANQYTFSNLRPSGIYEMAVVPFISATDKGVPVNFRVVSSDQLEPILSPDTGRLPAPVLNRETNVQPTIEKEPELAPDTSSERPLGKQQEKIHVRVFGPIAPVATGRTAYLECDYPTDRYNKPRITWKRIIDGTSRYIYNQKMPPTESGNRINMMSEQTLRIKDFRPDDAGTYECTVTFDTPDSFKVGSGTAELIAREVAELAAPTNFKFNVIDAATTTIRWQQPQPAGVTGYIVRYWPTTRRFGEYEENRVTARHLDLNDLTEGNEYNVEIRSTDGNKLSEPLIGQFDQLLEEVPTPINFQAAMVSGSQARITWEQPDTEGITGYTVQYWDVSQPSAGNLREVSTSEPEVLLDRLVDGTVYQVWIRAMKGTYPSPQLVGQFTKTTPTPPNTPNNIRFSDIGSDRVTITWDAPFGWRPTDKYRVRVDSTNEDNPLSRQFPDYAPKTLIVNQLRPGVIYKFTVYSVRDGLVGQPAIKHVKTVENIILSAPYPDFLTLECKAHIYGKPFRTKWYKIDSSGKAQPIFTSTSTTTRNSFTPNRDAIQFTGRLSSRSISQLTISNVRYPDDFGKYKCVTTTRTGDGSDVFDLIAKYPSRMEPPVRFQFEITGDTSARVSWEHPYPEDITGYVVRYWPTIRRFGPEKQLETRKMEANLTNLREGTEYQVEIKSKINNRVSDDSLVGQFINFANVVKNVNVERLDHGDDLKLTWENPPDIDGVQLSILTKNGLWNDQPPMSPDTTSRRIHLPLEDGETVSFKITTLKNNIPSPLHVDYTEKSKHPIVEVEGPVPYPEISRPGNEAGRGDTQLSYPTAPSNLVLMSIRPTVMRVRWTATPDVYFDTYQVNVTNLVTGKYEIFNVRKSYIQIANLAPYGKYQVSVTTVRNGIHSFPIYDTLTLGDVIEVEPETELAPEEGPDHDERVPGALEKQDREVSSAVPAPTNLRFSNVMRSRFTVSWNSPEEDITDFGVKYRPSGSDDEWKTEEVVHQTSVTLRELTPNVEYEVRVFSYYVTGEKSFPIIGTQRTQGATHRRVILKQPNARITDKTNSSFIVRWFPQEADHRVIVTPLGGAGRRQTLNVTRGTNSVNVMGLDAGRKHRTTVTALSDGRRSKSAVLHATTKPNQIEDLRTSAVGSTTITLIWIEPPSTLTTGYRVIYIPTSTHDVRQKDVTSNRVELTNLEPDSEYTIQVQTKQGNELSAPTSLTVRTKPEAVDVPEDVSVTVSGDTFNVGWSPVRDAEFYEVEYYPEDDEEIAVTTRVSASNTEIEIPAIYPGHYVVKVRAGNYRVQSPSRDMTITMPVKSPERLELSDVDSDSLHAAWEAPSTDLYSPEYDVIALPYSVHTPLQLPSEKRTDKLSYDFERLHPNTEYQIEVVSRYNGMKSEPLTAIVRTAPLESPRDLRTTLSRDGMRVVWSPVEGVDNYKVTYYRVRGDANPVTVSVPAEMPYYDLTTSNPGQYAISVTAVKGGQESPSAEIRETIGVDAPRNIRFTDVTDDSVVVEWSPPRTRQRFQYEVMIAPADDLSQTVTRTTENNWYPFEDLQPGTEYTVQVVSLFGSQRSEPISDEVTTEVPKIRRVDAPTAVDNRPIEVSWESVPEADSYIVTYHPVGGVPVTVDIPNDENRYILSDLAPETRYVIEVTALIDNKKSEPNTIYLTTGHVGTPTELETVLSDDVTTITWSPVDNVDYYEITYYPVGGRYKAISDISTSPSYEIEGVSPGDYEITVVAVKSDYRSPAARFVQSIGVKPPTKLLFTDVVEDEFIAVWTASPSRNIVAYEVRLTPANDVSEVPISRETTENWIEFRNLLPGTDYVVEVKAKSEYQESEPLTRVVTTAVPSPGRVRGTVLYGQDEPIRIAWDEVPDAESYEVIYYPIGGNPQSIFVGGDETNTILRDLLPDTEYVVEVQTLMNGKPSRPTKIRLTTPLETPDSPDAQPLTSDKPGTSAITVTWDKDGTVPEYEIKYYSVVRVGDDLVYGEPQYRRVSSQEHGVVLEDLLPATEYIVEVTAVDGSKESRPGNVTLVTPLDQPENVEIEEPGQHEVTINWQPPQGDITNYIVKFIPTDGSDIITLPVDAERHSVRATGLNPGTEYEVQVIAQNKIKRIVSSPLVQTIRTKHIITKPEDVRLHPESDGSFTITWNAPRDDVYGYEVTWTKSEGATMQETLQVFNETEAILPPLKPNTEYDITIQSITDTSDEPREHDSVTRRIKTGIPVIEPPLSFPGVTDGSVVVQWPVPKQEQFLTGYRVQIFPKDGTEPESEEFVFRTANTASLMGLKPNTTYRVEVTPHIGGIIGQPVPAFVTTDPLREVPAPDFVSVPETTSEDIVVQWYVPNNHEYITQFNVIVQDEDGDVVAEENVPGDSNTVTISDLKPATSYDVFVQSQIGDRKSQPVHELATTVPEQPLRVLPSRVMSNQFEVSWMPGDGEVLYYLVNVIPEDNPLAREQFFHTEDTIILIPGLEPDTTYSIEVVAVGQGELESVPTKVRVTTASRPEAQPAQETLPEQAIAFVPGLPEMVINWDRQTNAPVVSYQVLYQTQQDDQPSIITVPSQFGEIVLTNLKPNEEYSVWVRGILDSGEIIDVPITGHETVTRIPIENYKPLTEEPITAPQNGRVDVIWENLGPDITQYGLRFSGPGFEDEQQVVVPGQYTSILVSGLIPGEEYIMSVIGLRDGVEPVLVHNVHVGMSDIVPDETAVTASTENGQVTIQWVSDFNQDEENKVIGYKIIFDRKCCLGEPEMAWVPGKDSDTATIGMLEPDTEYVFTVEAATSDGHNIPVSSVEVVNEVEFPETRLTEKLEPPTILALDAEGYTSTVHWQAPTEEERPVTHYTISYVPIDNEYAPTLRVTVPKTETSHTMTGLSPNTAYNITIQSTNLPTETISEPATVVYFTPAESQTTEEVPRHRPVNVVTESPTAPIPVQTPTTTPVPEPQIGNTRPSERQPDEDTLTFTPEDSYATIAWEPHDDFTTRVYRVTYAPEDRPDDIEEVILPGYADRVTLTSLEPDTPYETHVEAITDTDEELPRGVILIEDELPEELHPYRWLFKPNITDIERQGEDTAIIHWVNPRRQPRKVTQFVLQLKPKFRSDTSRNIRVEIPANKSSHSVSGLVPNEHYIVTLQAVNQPTVTRSGTATREFTNTAPDQDFGRPTTTSVTSTPTKRTPVILEEVTTALPEPLRNPDEDEPQEGGPDEEEPTASTITDTGEDEVPGVEALSTFDGNVIINWTPAKSPVDHYILQLQLADRSSPTRNITVPGDKTWVNIPNIPQEGYNIKIFTSGDEDISQPELIYNVKLDKSNDRGGFRLVYEPITSHVTQEGADRNARPEPTSTHEVYVRPGSSQATLSDEEYLLQQPDREYTNWLEPTRHRGADSITLRWNPPKSVGSTTVHRYQVSLVPIDNPEADTLYTNVLSNASYTLPGLQPGVSYRFNATYTDEDGAHSAATFVIPAFSRSGLPIVRRRYGISDVWMKELRSRELLLQWENFPGATEYTVEYQESPDGQLFRQVVDADQRWIVLPELVPGHIYTLNIFATVRGTLTKIYTVTVRRKVTGPSPPSKIEWYNMHGHSVDLAWSAPPGYTSGYRLTYRLGTDDDGGSPKYVVNLPGDVTMYHLTGLIPGEIYTITLQSISNGKLSRAMSFPLRMTIPTVRRIYFQQTAPKVIVIRWPKLPEYVTGYMVQVRTVSPAGEDLVPETILPPEQTDFTIENVMPGVRYEFRITTLIDDKTSKPVTLQLWILHAESKLSRIEQTGTWTVSWTGNAYEVDHWKIEVKRFGSSRPIFIQDNIDRFQTRFDLPPLDPNTEYTVYIYGVKNNVVSSPIQIHIPANPNNFIQRNEKVTSRQQHTYTTGPQIVRKFIVRKKPTQIDIELIPISTVDKYDVKYKKSTESLYTTSDVEIAYGRNNRATVTLKYLDPGTDYNISITAYRGNDRNDMSITVDTPVRRVIQRQLPPLGNIRGYEDTNPDAPGFYIRWSAPSIPVSYYTIKYNYTGMERPLMRQVTQPLFYLPNIPSGGQGTFVLSYTTRDGRTSPKSVMTMSYSQQSYEQPSVVRSQAHSEVRNQPREELP